MVPVGRSVAVNTITIDGREYCIERVTWTGTSGLSFDVYDVATGLCLTPYSFDDEPGEAEVRQLLDNLRADVTNDTIDHFFVHDIDRLCQVLSKG